ncbi:MAG: EamA family transporter [Chloroflexi bacterium]|nr:EamA family transporter [Chloroflexota bacterium]
MPLFYISFGIAILSSVFYHIAQKATSPLVNPAIALLVTYASAFILTIPLIRIFPLNSSLAESLRRVNWATFGLAIAIVGLEIGFLLAYRSGWSVNLTGVAVNVAAAVVLVPVGITFFREQPSLINIMGVFVCIAGLIMLNK